MVYAIIDDDANKAYIGQTTQPLVRRVSGHRSRDSLIGAALRQGRPESFRLAVLELHQESTIVTERKEAAWIEKYGTLAPDGYNVYKGSEYKASSTQRAKASASLSAPGMQEKRCATTKTNRFKRLEAVAQNVSELPLEPQRRFNDVYRLPDGSLWHCFNARLRIKNLITGTAGLPDAMNKDRLAREVSRRRNNHVQKWRLDAIHVKEIPPRPQRSQGAVYSLPNGGLYRCPKSDLRVVCIEEGEPRSNV